MAGDRVVDDPLTREAAPRGVEPWQLTPGAPPVRKARPPRARSLLRDATIHNHILHKSRTPVPAPLSRKREAETARKPEGHEREFYKPAAPLLTNVVVDRPPPVRKDAALITWDPAPERVAAPDDDPTPTLEDVEHAWFLSADGTLEPAVERVSLPPRRIAAFLAVGAAIGAGALVAVAIGQGAAGSQAEAVGPSVETVLGAPPLPEDVAVEEAAAPVVVEEAPPAPIPPRTKKRAEVHKTEAPKPIWGEIEN